MPDTSSQTHPPPAFRPLVLIADNDAGVSGLLREILQRMGLRCEVVADGRQALERLREGGVQVLVTDLDMPHLDGRGLLDALHQVDPPPRTLVISGYLTMALDKELRQNPAVKEVLAKPFDVLAFAGLVQALAGGGLLAEGSAGESKEVMR